VAADPTASSLLVLPVAPDPTASSLLVLPVAPEPTASSLFVRPVAPDPTASIVVSLLSTNKVEVVSGVVKDVKIITNENNPNVKIALFIILRFYIII
jgi:hypothetical protein